MSSESEEYFSEEEDSVVNQSTSGSTSRNSSAHDHSVDSSESEVPSADVTVLDTESEDEIVQQPSKKGGRRRAVILSDSDEEDELDQRGLSPRTRMSITGVRPKDIDDDSSEIESDEEQQLSFSNNVNESVVADNNADATYAEELENNEEAVVADDQPRYSTQFVSSIEEELHSTLFPVAPLAEQQPSCESANSSSSDVLILSHKETPIEISSSSSDEDTSNNKENLSHNKIASLSASSTMVKEESVKSVNVSRDFYTEESRKIAELSLQLSEAEKLYEKVAHKLPDNGSQIMKRINGLRDEIFKKTKYLESVNVQQETTPKKVQTTQKPLLAKPLAKELDWNDLSAAVNLIQPTHTGTQGLATFNAQKALTVESLKDLHGSLKDCPAEDVQAEDPPGLKVQLMGHQKHALAWMSWREQQRPRGGILADDMGLGKTLTMISLVLACKNRQESDTGNKSEDSDDEDDTDNNRKAGAWYSKGRKDNYRGGTLVVCPASLIRQWENEVNSKLSRHRLTVCVHHGSNRDAKAKHLRTYDMVVTTYNIVTREQKVGGALFGVKWRRVILDEAHVIRNHKSQSSLAVNELLAKFRWALTGTPIQNKELDVYAQLKFLRCSPFDDLATWKRWIDNKSAGGQERLNLLMKSIMLRRTKVQLQLNGKLNSLPNKKIELVEMNLDKHEMNVYQRVMTYSRTLFAQFLLQRAEKDTDSHYANDAAKPTYNQIQNPNGAYYKMHEKFARMAGHSKEVKSHEILVLLLRLRQICCHPGLIDSMLEEENGDLSHGDSMENSSEIDLLAHLNKLTISDTSDSNLEDGVERPLEGEDIHIAKASQNVLKRTNPVFDFNRPSTKMLRAMDLVKTILKNDDKVIVVSQWKTVLDILRDMLNREKLRSLELNGTIPVKNRQDIVNDFNDPCSSKRILLLSLTAGGVGLNLIGANHLILLDLHWNPQLEAQAQDRIYRVGQKKDVVIYKMICMETVEQRIKMLQDRKLELADGLLTGKVSSKLSIDDLKGLFGM